MQLIRETVLTPFGIKQNYHLPKDAKDKWLINERGKLRYLLALDESDPVSTTIQDWMEGDTLSLEEILIKINRKSGARLAEHSFAWGVVLRSELVEVELENLPWHYIEPQGKNKTIN